MFRSIWAEEGEKEITYEEPVKKEKGRGHIDLFGPLNVKVPYSASNQEHCGYLILRFDQSIAFLRSIFCVPGANKEKPFLELLRILFLKQEK